MPLVEHGGDRKSDIQVDNVNLNKGGENSEYLTARIARDNPEILERMKAGEFPSVRAAALEAGIVQRRVSVPIEQTLGCRRARARRSRATG